MPTETLEVLDANIIALLEEPVAQIPGGLAFFETDDLRDFLRRPITPSQSLQVDASGTLVLTQQFESMRSQKAVVFAPTRIGVHDRSGRADVEQGDIAETLGTVAKLLGVTRTKVVGANIEWSYRLDAPETAASKIASAILKQPTSYLPEHVQGDGASVRLFLTGRDEVQYLVAIEPRFNDRTTQELWMSSNASITVADMPSIDQLKQLIADNTQVLRHIARTLFSLT